VSTPAPTDLLARVAELERQVKDLRARVALLEKAAGVRKENPDDRSVVREKVTFDWQA
jgi:hypothetical protein